MPTPIPLRPDYSAATAGQSRSFWRGATAQVVGTLRSENPEKFVQRVWPRDETARLISRAVSAQANTTTVGWAQELTAVGVGPVLINLAPASAAARLYANALQLDFDAVHQVLVPRIATPANATWVGEGSPAAMVQPIFSSVLIGPVKKLLFGAAVTSEIANYSNATAQGIIQAALADAASVAADAQLLSNNAADTTKPAGLLQGVSDLGATAGGGLAALISDLGKIVDAFSTAKISSEGMMLICNPKEAVKLRGLLQPGFAVAYQIVGSLAVTAGSLIAIQPSAIGIFVSTPEIEVSKDGLVHMESVTPRNIDTQAVSESVKSAWQAGLVLLKCRLRATWGSLATGAVQLVSSVTW